MNKHERMYAALGSVALNLGLALVLSQAAGATVPATNEWRQEPTQHVIYVTEETRVEPRAVHKVCGITLRDRTIAAVVLAFML